MSLINWLNDFIENIYKLFSPSVLMKKGVFIGILFLLSIGFILILSGFVSAEESCNSYTNLLNNAGFEESFSSGTPDWETPGSNSDKGEGFFRTGYTPYLKSPFAGSKFAFACYDSRDSSADHDCEDNNNVSILRKTISLLSEDKTKLNTGNYEIVAGCYIRADKNDDGANITINYLNSTNVVIGSYSTPNIYTNTWDEACMHYSSVPNIDQIEFNIYATLQDGQDINVAVDQCFLRIVLKSDPCLASCILPNQYVDDNPTAEAESNWTNMNNQLITSADLNDSVKMKFSSTELSDGESVNFTIYNSGNSAVYSVIRVADAATVYNSWRANVEGVYTFKGFIVEESGIQVTSGILTVSNTVNNSAPVVQITSPSNGETFNFFQSIIFNQISTDEDDDIALASFLWALGDGRSKIQNSFEERYDSTGSKVIILNVTDERGAVGTDSIEIIINPAPSAIDECEDYLNPNTCEDDLYNVSRLNPLWLANDCVELYVSIPGTAEYIKNCACYWNFDVSLGGKCQFGYNYTGGGPGGIGNSNPSSCTISSTEGACTDGLMTLNVVAHLLSGTYFAECQNDSFDVPCGKPSVVLPFFALPQMIITLLGIALIYFILIKRKKILLGNND